MIDSHAHLTNSTLYSDIDAVLLRAQQAGLKKIVNICTEQEELDRGLLLAQKYPWVYNTASATPHDAHLDQEAFFQSIIEQAKAGKLVAIGETGLEYHYCLETAPQQKKWLVKFLQLALEVKLPVVIHCREAFADFFEIIDAEYKLGGVPVPGVLHCFTGSLEEAKGVIERGWMLSLSGIVTFKKSLALQEVAKWAPLDQLLIETDAPFLAPQSRRGQTNEPAYLAEIAQFVAVLKGISLEELVSATASNACRVFNI